MQKLYENNEEHSCDQLSINWC